MAKVRVVLAEVEGSDDAVLGAIRSFVGVTENAPPIPPAIEIPAPAAEAARAIASPAADLSAEPEAKPQRRTRRKGDSGKSGASASASPSPAATALSNAEEDVLAELRKGERTMKHLMDSTGLTYASTFGALKRLQKRGAIESRKIDGGVGHIHRLVAG